MPEHSPQKYSLLFEVMMLPAFMQKTFRILAFVGTLTLFYSAAPAAEIEWEVLNRLDAGSRPLDVTVSADGRSVFVLAEDGRVHLFDADGNVVGQIAVGAQAERIAVDPEGERLYVTNRETRQVEIVQIDILREINLSGAPFKGREQAPVVIAVFSDFQ